MNLVTPHAVDLNVNWVCNLNCEWCWWPVHTKAIESLTDTELEEVIKFLAEHGTRSIIFTGWEPLLKQGLRKLLRGGVELWMRNTLSTNGILLWVNKDILDLVQDVWIPLDGSTQNLNQAMRQGTPLHFSRAIESLKLIQKERPEIDLTVRTVVSEKNYQDVSEIGRVLLENWIDPKKIRWKLYQCSTSGPRRWTTITDWWLIKDEKFHQVIENVRKNNPQFSHIQAQPLKTHTDNRYLLIMPNGNIEVIQSDKTWLPYQITIGTLTAGDISASFERIIMQNPDIFTSLTSNTKHG